MIDDSSARFSGGGGAGVGDVGAFDGLDASTSSGAVMFVSPFAVKSSLILVKNKQWSVSGILFTR